LKKFKKNRALIFFCGLIIFLVVQPLISDFFLGLNIFLTLLMATFLLLNPYLVTAKRSWLIFAIIALIITILDNVFGAKTNNFFFLTLKILGLISYFTVIIHGFWSIIKSDGISSEDVFNSLSGYFLIAIAFSLTYGVFLDFNMIEFSPQLSSGNDTGDLLYYSFSTLTTLGYGDIVPVSKIAKRLSGIEAATGVLYVAVFIGYLIGAKRKQHK